MKTLGSERGAQLLEFAMVVPVLLLIVAGIAESGLLFHSAEITLNAAREGARLAVLPGSELDGYASVRTRVTNYLTAERLTRLGDPTAPTIDITPATIDVGPGLTAHGVRVTVTYTYHCLLLGPLAGVFNRTFTDTITFQSSALMRTQVAAVGL